MKKPICTKCGSDDICIDVPMRWNIDRGYWQPPVFDDSGMYCNDCGADSDEIEWEELNDG